MTRDWTPTDAADAADDAAERARERGMGPDPTKEGVEFDQNWGDEVTVFGKSGTKPKT